MMNKKSFQIIGTLLLVALAASLFYLIFNVQGEMKKESGESHKNFTRLVADTADSAEFFGFMTDNFIAHQKQLQSHSTTLKMLLITDAQGIVYASPVSSMIAGFDAVGKPIIKTSSPFEKVVSSSINIHQTGQITVTAVYSLLRENIAFFYVRNTFLMILAVTLLTLILILVAKTQEHDNVHKEKTAKPAFVEKNNDLDDIFEIETEPENVNYDETEIVEMRDDDIETENANQTSVSSQEIDMDDDFNIGIEANTVDSNDVFDFPETTSAYTEPAVSLEQEVSEKTALTYHDEVPLKTEDLPISDETDIDFSEELAPSAEMPQKTEADVIDEPTDNAEGLFSKATGVCWETYLIDRLDTEISRAVETEQDLALFVIRIEHLDRLDMVSRKISAYLISQFKFRDLIFELGKDGYAVILPAVTFSSAMKDAEKLYTELLSILTTEGYKKRLTIGLTLRAGRILPGGRFLQEASNACAKAMQEQTMPVVAFRADPDKYRSFIAETE